MYKNIGSIFVWTVLLSLIVFGCQQDRTNTELPNPASVYCEDHNGTLEIRESRAGQYGVCVFDDGSECDEWAYYRGECLLGQSTDVSEPPVAPAYINTAYSFSFNPDGDYSLEERDHQVLFLRDGHTLTVGYRTAEEQIEVLEPVAIDGLYEDAGFIRVLGSQVPRQRLINDEKVKLVAYAPFQIVDLQIFIRLWVESKDQNSVDIPAYIENWADSITETFALLSEITEPVLILRGTNSIPDHSGWKTYTLGAYGFSFRYPVEWAIDDSVVNSINLTRNGYMLHIGYRWPGEEIPLVGTGTPSGELLGRTPIMVLSQAHSSQILVDNGRTVAVFYELVVTPQVEIGFRADLLGTHTSDISDEMLAEIDHIVTTLTLLPR